MKCAALSQKCNSNISEAKELLGLHTVGSSLVVQHTSAIMELLTGLSDVEFPHFYESSPNLPKRSNSSSFYLKYPLFLKSKVHFKPLTAKTH